MVRRMLDARMRMQIELAITAGCDCVRTLADQEVRAHKLGLNGVEIDAARAGSSFDVRTSAAVDYACCVAADENEVVSASATKARAVGLTANDLSAIQTIVKKAIKP